MRKVLLSVLCLAVVGCGVSTTPTADFVPVSGKVTHAGAPVASANLNFQPTGRGTQKIVAVVDGKFETEMTPGRYTYFITAGSSPEAVANIPPKYAAGDIERQVDIDDGTELEIELD